MKIPFHEAWIGPKGEVLCNGRTHYHIALNYIKDNHPDVYKTRKTKEDDWYDFCYDFMANNKFARLYSPGSRRLYLTTYGEDEDLIRKLIQVTKRYVKHSDYFKELIHDRTGRTIYSKNDTL